MIFNLEVRRNMHLFAVWLNKTKCLFANLEWLRFIPCIFLQNTGYCKITRVILNTWVNIKWHIIHSNLNFSYIQQTRHTIWLLNQRHPNMTIEKRNINLQLTIWLVAYIPWNTFPRSMMQWMPWGGENEI